MEPILQEAGSCGRFQIIQMFWVFLVRSIFVWGAFMMIFGNYNPGWRCKSNAKIDSLSNLNGTSYTIYMSVKNSTLDDVSNVTDALENHHIVNNQLKVGNSNDVISLTYDAKCDVIESCGGDIEFDPASSTIITEFGLVCDKEWIATVILIMANLGLFLGASVSGLVTERFGRKTGLYLSPVVVMVSSLAAIFSPNWYTYACFSFLMAFGSYGTTIPSYVLCMEFLDSKWRGAMASRPVMSLSLCVMSILMSLLKDWRHLHIFTFILSFVSCLGYFVVCESPRWLFVNSQPEKGKNIIQKIAKRNGKQPVAEDTLENFLVSLENENDERGQTYSYMDIFRSREYTIAALKLALMLSLNVIIYRAISFGLKSVPGNFYENAIVSSFFQAAILMSAIPVTNVTGRRCAGFLYSILGSTCCFVIVATLFLAEGYTRETVIKISAHIARAVTQAVVASNSLLTAEIFPTAIRSVAIAFNATVASLASFVFVFAIPKDDDDVSFAVCYSAMAVCFFVNISLFYSLPETNKLNLKDKVKRTKNLNRSKLSESREDVEEI